MQVAFEPANARADMSRLGSSGLSISSMKPTCPATAEAASNGGARSSSGSLANLDAFSKHTLPKFPFETVRKIGLHGFEWHSRDLSENADWRHSLHVPHVHSVHTIGQESLKYSGLPVARIPFEVPTHTHYQV